MLNELKAAIFILIMLTWPELGAAQSCVQSGIAAGDNFTCAFSLAGSTMCWGDNEFGELGNGTRNTPVPVPTVVTDSSGQLLGGVQQIAANSLHTCAISGPTAAAVCWGDDRAGQLGDSKSIGNCPSGRIGPFGLCISATQVPVVTSNGAALTGVMALAAGDQHTCALGGANVQCWGDNGSEQLGDGQSCTMEPFRPNPNDLVLSILDAPAVKISAGGFHTCAVMLDRTARCWGNNVFGQLGNGVPGNPANTCVETTPQTVITAIVGNPPRPVPLQHVMSIAAGQFHTCALLPLGTVECWGKGDDGELGRSDTTLTPLPVVVVDSSGQPLNGVEDIAAGLFHTCALMNGTVQCWGCNAKGQLGSAGAVNSPPCGSAGAANSASPVTVPTTDTNGIALPVAHIAAGENHTCAALAAGGVRCWGDNSFGQLGASTAPNTGSATPVAVGGLCNCPGSIMYCNGQCTDTTSDPQNCNGCGNLCTGGTCVASACTCPPADGALCPASGSSHVCANTTSDPSNCGKCGRVCSDAETCVNSACVCPSGNTCGGRCVDLQTDNNNCGRCGRHCRINPPCNREESGCTTCENGDCVAF
jgi:alpha-tubulin suppressor-like RCC1 family protein